MQMKEVNKEISENAGAYLLVHCGGRRLGIGDRIDEVAKQLKKESNGKPFIAVFTLSLSNFCLLLEDSSFFSNLLLFEFKLLSFSYILKIIFNLFLHYY